MGAPTPDEVILGLLVAQPRHGYELLDYFRSRTHLGRVWTMSSSQLYAVLKRLEQQGLITGRQVESPDAPPRIEYAVTADGLHRLHAWLNEQDLSPSIRRIRVEFLSRLYIARLLDIPVGDIVQRQKEVCQRQRDRFLKEREQAERGVEALAVDFVIGQLDAALQWLDRCQDLGPDSLKG